MDFDYAAKRFEKDQSRLRDRRTRSQPVSAKAKREAEYRRKQQEKLRQERQRKQRQLQHMKQYLTSCDRAFRVKSLKGDEGLHLKATSIHGDGDKIALPPSVLQRLTDQGVFNDGSSPWMFRIGIRNESYSFPASEALKDLTVPNDDAMEEEEDPEEEEEDDDMDVDKELSTEAYLEELSHKYLSYSHGTVVEFTQEEGHVGLPASIARALLQINNDLATDQKIAVKRTVDPAGERDRDEAMETEGEKTPGHLAWGAFDVPDVPIEITLLRLPKGKSCTLVPTAEAVQNGFHRLKDVKLVLEQSLIRTRATLSVGDMVHSWHRGVRFDLDVTKVEPADVNAVSCINTDIEVDIGELEEDLPDAPKEPSSEATTSGHDGGRTLGSSTAPISSGTARHDSPGQRLLPPPLGSSAPVAATASPVNLLPEPTEGQKEGVCTVQIKSSAGTGRRRFDVRVATTRDLFAFAASVAKLGVEEFQLVTRYPRRVFTIGDDRLDAVNIQAGQELFMVERL